MFTLSGEEIHVVLKPNKTALASLSMGLVVIGNNHFIRFNLDYFTALRGRR